MSTSEHRKRTLESHSTPPTAESAAGQDVITSSPSKAQVDAQGRTLNPRSCVTCRRRKVKCDKTVPCSNCRRAQIECVYPRPERAPRKARKTGPARDKELLERLRRLEGVVKSLGSTEADVNEEYTSDRAREDEGGIDPRSDHESEHGISDKTKLIDEHGHGGVESRFGRLVMEDGKSRYVTNSFWANLSNEVEDLKGILNQSSDSDEGTIGHHSVLDSFGSNSHQGFIFGLSSQNIDLLSFHPPPDQIDVYWNIYKDRVDPLCKVLHIPTLQPKVLSVASHLDALPRGFEALLFTIYYGVVTSLQAQDCVFQFGEEKSVLLARYRFAVEQALARANFLTTEEIIVLQAFVIFLICLRRNHEARVIWTLTGLVVRSAQTIGIHRDGTHFGITPFETEMRRRLWWQVCILDVRASEDHGCDPTIIEQTFDTKLPLNINDSDIDPDMKEYPLERQGCTDMSFCLIRYEMSNTFRRVNYHPPGQNKLGSEKDQPTPLKDVEKWITECHERLEEKYLKNCDMNVPLYWVTATVARLMMSKMWLMVYHPFQRMNGGATLPPEIKDKLFITSLENLEYSMLLQTEPRTVKWGWLFKTYTQWHALAFILTELCHRTTGDFVERAWIAVEKSREGVNGSAQMSKSQMWRPLRKLHQKAKDARQRTLQEEQLVTQCTTNPPTRTYSPNANPMFGHPSRPRTTRAPLSQAQLQRFVEGPTFGQVPLDKHELLRSPTGSDSKDSSEAVDPSSNLIQRPLPRDFDPNSMATNAMVGPGNPAMPTIPAAGPTVTGFGQNPSLNNNPNFNFNDFATSPQALGNTLSGNNQSDDLLRMDTLVSSDGFNPNFSSVMDTSADLYWESWDQLVRQFGMDVDSGAGMEDGTATNWNGPPGNIQGGASSMRMGLGMNGGDWF